MSLPQLAPDVRRVSPQLLIGGTPLRALRLSAAGGEALDALLSGAPHPGVVALRAKLLDAGLLLLPPGPARLSDLTVVVPVRGTQDEVRRVLDGVPPGVPVVVVDDGSVPPLDVAGVTVVRHETSRGPAAARNAGAARASTPLVAFVDAGVRLPSEALARLTGHVADDRVVAVAPRVVSDASPGAVGVLEQQLCALDQGPAAGEVRPGSRLSYVPSTALLVRKEVFDAAGGFDEDLHVGEDVDLVWRLARSGVVRYDPEVVVRHAPRTSLRAALSRRRDYGTSAAPLDRRHPGELRHLQVSPWSLLPWAAATVHPAAGFAAAAALVAAAPRRLPSLPGAQACRVAAAGQWASFAATGRYAVRPGLPLTLLGLWGSRRVRRVAPLLAAGYVAGSTRVRSGPAPDLPLRALLHVLDDLAYSTGVWGSAVRERRWQVVLPGAARSLRPTEVDRRTASPAGR